MTEVKSKPTTWWRTLLAEMFAQLLVMFAAVLALVVWAVGGTWWMAGTVFLACLLAGVPIYRLTEGKRETGSD